MCKVGICMANGCEEIEALTVVDLLRREGFDACMISTTGEEIVKGSHNIEFRTNEMIENVSWDEYDAIVLPGGMPGTINLENNDIVQAALREMNEKGALIAAICAAPTILGHNGIAKGKTVTSYPGNDDAFEASRYVIESVVRDGNVITSRGMGTAIEFGLEIIKYFKGEEAASKMAKTIIY